MALRLGIARMKRPGPTTTELGLFASLGGCPRDVSRPAMTKRGQIFTGNAAFVHKWKEFVMEVGPTAIDFIEEDKLGIPHRTRSAEVIHAAVVIGNWNTNEIVVVQE